MTAYTDIADVPFFTYDVIMADMPVAFDTYSDEGKAKSAERHYDTMSLDDIEDMTIADIAKPDSVLFFWITAPFLAAPRHLVNVTKRSQLFSECEGIHHRVMNRWGFTSKALAFVWVKLNKTHEGELITRDDFFRNTGRYTSQNVELCFVGTRGKPPRPLVNLLPQIVAEPIREHSRKPDEVRKRIEKMYGGKRIELFGREEFEGWDVLGNQVGMFKGEK